MELFAADGHDAGGCERVTGKSGMRPAHELVGGQRQHAEHAVAHHLRTAAEPDMATAELVLESAVDALTGRTFVASNLLGKLKADPLQAPGGVGPIPWTGQRSSGSDIAAELLLGVAACVMSRAPVSAL